MTFTPYLRISVTDRCELRCIYCMPGDGVRKVTHEEVLSFEEIIRFVRTVKSRFGLSKIRITGGEPLVRKGLPNLIRMLKNEKVMDIALTTNGQKLETMAEDLKRSGLTRVNVSLDSLNARIFKKLTHGGELKRTLRGIEAARTSGLNPVKINTVVMKGYNENEIIDITRFAFDKGCHIRFLELMPVAYASDIQQDLFISTPHVKNKLQEVFTLKAHNSNTGETSSNFSASDESGSSGTIGFISPQTNPFCGTCTRLRLTSTGELISCLARQRGPNIKTFLRDHSSHSSNALANCIEEEFSEKHRRYTPTPLESMVVTGG